jgi:hypothetical protein
LRRIFRKVEKRATEELLKEFFVRVTSIVCVRGSFFYGDHPMSLPRYARKLFSLQLLFWHMVMTI